MTNPIPEGYGTITPYLVVADVGGLIAFLRRAFDVTRQRSDRTLERRDSQRG